MLASTKKILWKAHKNKYAVPHFNVNNMEILQAVVEAGIKQNSPIIVATSEGAIKYAGINFLYTLTKTATELAKIPVALHLDHGRDMKIVRQAIALGYSSVMYDGSHLSFEENIKNTKKVVQLAHEKGISVEAELGTIGGAEDTVSARKIVYTDPLKAKEFAEQTGCDFLAVAIGTSHGAYKFSGRVKLRLDLLRKIKQIVKMPLCLHGASEVPRDLVRKAERYGADLSDARGVPDAQIKQAIKLGINKINTDTDLRIAFDAAVRKYLAKHTKDFDPRHMLAPAREEMQRVAEHRIKIFGSKGKA